MAKPTPPYSIKTISWEDGTYKHVVTFGYVKEASQYNDTFFGTGEVTLRLAHAQYRREPIHAPDVDPNEWFCGDCNLNCTGLEWCPACAVERMQALKAAKDTQVGGDHYAKREIQPWDIIDCYGLDFYAGNALKYLLRYRDKNGVEDLKKARHYLDKLIEVTEGKQRATTEG